MKKTHNAKVESTMRVLLSAAEDEQVAVPLAFELGDPLIGLAITLIILRITWQSWLTIRASPAP